MFLGSNWVLTVHSAEIAVLDDFRKLAEGKGEIGLLDGPVSLTSAFHKEFVMDA